MFHVVLPWLFVFLAKTGGGRLVFYLGCGKLCLRSKNTENAMTQQKINFKAVPRTLVGKKVKKLRSQGQVPANIMGHSIESVPISVGSTQFVRLYNQVGDSGLFYLEVEGETEARPVLVDQVDSDPLSGLPQHVVFRQVNLKEKVTAEIPVEVIGEFKLANAVVITVHDSIEVEALPADLPEKFEVDISSLSEIGQAITFKDLSFDREKVELQVSEEELDTPVVLVQEVKEEPVEEVPTEETAEGEAAPTAEAAPEAPAEEA